MNPGRSQREPGSVPPDYRRRNDSRWRQNGTCGRCWRYAPSCVSHVLEQGAAGAAHARSNHPIERRFRPAPPSSCLWPGVSRPPLSSCPPACPRRLRISCVCVNLCVNLVITTTLPVVGCRVKARQGTQEAQETRTYDTETQDTSGGDDRTGRRGCNGRASSRMLQVAAGAAAHKGARNASMVRVRMSREPTARAARRRPCTVCRRAWDVLQHDDDDARTVRGNRRGSRRRGGRRWQGAARAAAARGASGRGGQGGGPRGGEWRAVARRGARAAPGV